MARPNSGALMTSPDYKKLMESKHQYKTSAIVVGFLTAIATMTGVMMSLMMVLHDMAPLYEPDHIPNGTVTMQQGNSTGYTEGKKSTLDVFLAILGFVVVALGVPNALYAMYSIELIFGAWKERPKMVLQWVLYTESTTLAQTVIVLAVVVGFFWVHKVLLALFMFSNFIILFLISSFFLNIVKIYYKILAPGVLPDVIFQKVEKDIRPAEDEEGEE